MNQKNDSIIIERAIRLINEISTALRFVTGNGCPYLGQQYDGQLNELVKIIERQYGRRIIEEWERSNKMTSKYKITANDLDEKGGVERLEAMGHDRVSIHEAMFKHTDGISNQGRTELMQNLYKRSMESRYGKPTRWI